jgi:hypothetical protein
MNLIRHVAKIANTDQRCVVAFMQIPGREDHALVIPIDNLPPRFEQAVMDVLKSPQGQQEEDFAVALSRHLLPDTGQNIFETLHSQGRLMPISVHQVLMMPSPNNPVKLSTILENLGRLPDQQARNLLAEYAVDKFNPHLNNQVAATTERTRSIARGLIVEAEMLELEARKKREQAYGIDTSLRPSPAQSYAASDRMLVETVAEPDDVVPDAMPELKRKQRVKQL